MKFFILIVLFILFYPTSAQAYVGPGLGAGTIAAITGVLLSIVMAIIGVFWYPIKRLFKKGKDDETLEETEPQADSNTTQNKDSQE